MKSKTQVRNKPCKILATITQLLINLYQFNESTSGKLVRETKAEEKFLVIAKGLHILWSILQSSVVPGEDFNNAIFGLV